MDVRGAPIQSTLGTLAVSGLLLEGGRRSGSPEVSFVTFDNRDTPVYTAESESAKMFATERNLGVIRPSRNKLVAMGRTHGRDLTEDAVLVRVPMPVSDPQRLTVGQFHAT